MRTRMPGVMMSFTLAAAVVVAGPVGAQTDGTVTYNMASGGPTVRTLVMHFRGSQELIEMPGGVGSMLMDASTGTRTILMNQQKMYMQMNANDIPQQSAQTASLSVTKDGSETVAGIPCTDYKITNNKPDQDSYEVCAAPGVPSMDPKLLMGGPMGSRMGLNAQVASVFEQLRGQGALKLYKIDGTNKTVVMEATKVDRTSPDPTMFAIPSGYTKVPAPAGMPGMTPGMPQPGQGQPKPPQ